MGQKSGQTDNALMVRFSAMIGILACVGDLYMIYLLGTRWSGYNPLLQAMSDLGHAGSPVARSVSTGWIVMGLMFMIFGYGFYQVFSSDSKIAKTAGWMLALYGIGEGLGSGLIAGTPGKILQSPSSILHNLLGGMGVCASILLPFIIIKMFGARKSSASFWYCWFTTVSGLLFFILFAISYIHHSQGYWLSLLGLWQRLFRLIYYLFFVYLAVLMINAKKTVHWNQT